MNKIDWIKQQINQGIQYLEKLNEIVPPSISMNDIAAYLIPNDRRILMNEYVYRSLLKNIQLNDTVAVRNDIETLTSTPNLSAHGLAVLQQVIESLQPQTLATLAGFTTVTIDDWNEAINI